MVRVEQDKPALPEENKATEQFRKPYKPGLRNGIIPEFIGISLIGVFTLCVISIGVASYTSMQRMRDEALSSHGQATANLIAAALATAVDNSEDAAVLLRHICAQTPSLNTAEWRRPDGTMRCIWPTDTAPKASESSRRRFTAGVSSTSGAPAGMLIVTMASVAATEVSKQFLYGGSASATIGILLFLWIYRRLRKHLRPMEAIERNLNDYASGVEKEFVALSLSDSLGHIAQSWNLLIDQLATLRNQESDTVQADFTNDALRRFESRTLRSTLDRLPIGLVRFGQELKASYVNAAAVRFLERSTDELVNAPLAEFLEEEVHTPLIGAYMRSSASMSLDRKRGPETQQTTLRFSIISADASSPDHEALLMIEDVSHFQEAERARDNFLYHVTHELRTPLTNIQAYAETLTGPDFDDEETRRECYNVIISETRRLSRLVEDILNVSQLEVGTARFEMSHVDIVRLLRQIVQDHLGAADEKHIDLTLKVAPKAPTIQGDKQRLAVLMTNLVGNAIKYTPNNGRVDVSLNVTEQCIEVIIADTGIGIGKDDQPHIFDKFYRAVSDKVQMIKGTGLGLAIAREVARLHGGDITLESELEKGSIFKIELPHSGDGA